MDATLAGGVLIVLVIEALRRATGNFLAVIVGLFLLYALVGHLVPGELQGREVALDRLTINLSMDSNGMLGMPLMVTPAVAIAAFTASVIARAPPVGPPSARWLRPGPRS